MRLPGPSRLIHYIQNRGMKTTLMALVLSLGLALLAASPVLAADSEPVAVTITSASALDDATLSNITGKQLLNGASAVYGGFSGGAAAIVVSYAEKGRVDAKDIAEGIFTGTVLGEISPGGTAVKNTQVFGRTVTRIAEARNATVRGAIEGAAKTAYDYFSSNMNRVIRFVLTPTYVPRLPHR